MNYNEALEYIHSVTWKGSRPGLCRTEELLCRIQNPQNKLKFIHVAGTNGKGSFCSMLSHILVECGYKVGLYTSPFVLRFNERIKVNNIEISDENLAQVTEFIKPHAQQMDDHPTEFELITGIAFEHFYREGCDYVILECGMGGRLDSTNVVENVELSVITGISLDHTEFLGDTIPKIAFEKAGIIKPNTPVLWCGNNTQATEVIKNRANLLNCQLYTPNPENLKIKETTLNGSIFDFEEYKDVKIPLLGLYQPINTSYVLCAVDILKKLGFCISRDNIYGGLLKTTWAARFEIICRDPLIIFDGGHNIQGVHGAVDSIKTYFGQGKVNVLTGVMQDKEYGEMAALISEVAHRVFCITPDNPRALSGEVYSCEYRARGVKSKAFDSVQDAVAQAVAECRRDNIPLVCMGSLYMYFEVVRAIRAMQN